MKVCKWAETVDKILFKFMYGVSVLAGISLIITALLCTVDSLSAKIFSYSIPNGTDLVTYMNIPIVFLAMGFIQIERGNTVVDLISNKFPKTLHKTVQVFGCLLGTFISIFLAYCEFDLTMSKLATGTKASSAANSFVVWPFAMVIAIGYLLVGLAFLWCIFRIFLIPPERRQGAMIPGVEGSVEVPLPRTDEEIKDSMADKKEFNDLSESDAERGNK